MGLDRDTVWKATEAERIVLADLLDSLTAQQWDAQSLCRGWRVRDVAAHVTLSTRVRPFNAMVGLARARGDFNRFVADDARARAERPPAQLVDELRRASGLRHRPPGTKPEDPLVDVLVHTQDIAVPLGIEVPTPTAAAMAAADRVWSMPLPFRARKRAGGVRLRASDAPWARGDGEEASGPLAAILLVLTGRRAGLDRLEGPGVATLAARSEP